ncbi:MAG: glycosyltransferase family 9 protein [Proteobacteria bacterium]|nr:glycosyltransferase family 9 protein [Pseudomonadota bacterium]MBS0462170.1 glycosyltransferase family 9 protein [Pseudomonadota bacterium]
MRNAPPRSVCLLRLSALGDVTHVLPVVHALRTAWPEVALTWVIGKPEHRLLAELPGVEFIVVDKASGWRGYQRLRRQLGGRRFDALLVMQLALRANVLSTALHADVRVGYDRARAKELHGLFVNRRIPPMTDPHLHVREVLAAFVVPLGLPVAAPTWDFPISAEARTWAAQQLPGEQPTLIVSPCSSHSARNWLPERYAAVGDHAAERGWRVVLCGGRSTMERQMADTIVLAMRHRPLDLTGKDSLPQLPALLERADLVLSPDSGPVHIANAVGTRVLGLYACTDPRRSGPCSDLRWTVDRYDAAARKFLGKPATDLAWGTKIEQPGAMALIEATAVIEAFERCAAAQDGGTTR